MQMVIAIVAFIGILCLEFLCNSESTSTSDHTDTLLTALVDIHKMRGYLSITMQIAASVLVAKILPSIKRGSAGKGFGPFRDQ